MKRSLSYKVAAVFGLAILALAGTAGAATWYVHPDSALNKIQAGLDSCFSGDTVLVAAGIYHENIVWPATEDIFLESERGYPVTVVDGGASGSVVTITGLELYTTHITGFTFTNGSASVGGGVHISRSYVLLVGCRVFGNYAGSGAGIACDSGTVTVRYCTVTGNNATSAPAGGIAITGVSTAVIESSTVSSNGNSGISYDDGCDVNVRYCNITGNIEYGMRYIGAAGTYSWAQHDWWGAASGPYNPIYNPLGMGDTVSDYVNFAPWLDAPVPGVAEGRSAPCASRPTFPTIVRGVLTVPASCVTRDASCVLVDVSGRRVLGLHEGVNDLSRLAPGVYFVRMAAGVTKVVIPR